MRSSLSRWLVFALCLALVVVPPMTARGADLREKDVRDAIEKGKRYLLKQQRSDGSWRSGGGNDSFAVGITSLVLLALINTGMTANDLEIQRGLDWLRKQDPTVNTHATYQTSLMIQALAAAKMGKQDVPRVARLAEKL